MLPRLLALVLFFTMSYLASAQVVVKHIQIFGNKKTKEHVILRELTFGVGDTLTEEALKLKCARSKDNLLNTKLFNIVTVAQVPHQEEGTVLINVVERWYIWPIPLLEVGDRNFNEWWETKDLSRLNYGMYLLNENFRGRREQLRLRIRLGYAEQYALRYRVPFLNEKGTLGMFLAVGYSRRREVNYGSDQNLRLLFSTEDHVRKELFSDLVFNYRNKLYTTHYLKLRYADLWLSDEAVQLNNNLLPLGANTNRHIEVSYTFEHDKRDLKVYPLKGHYFQASFSKRGIGLFKELNLSTVQGAFKQFIPISGKWFSAYSVAGKFESVPPSYYFQQGLGYLNNFVRGYEYYVLDGQHFGLFKSNLKYQLVAPRTGEFKSISKEQFSKFHYSMYLNAFFDAGYQSNDGTSYFPMQAVDNPLTNSFIFGYGLGLDFITYYDAAIRLEVSMNKQNEPGIYLHFLSPI